MSDVVTVNTEYLVEILSRIPETTPAETPGTAGQLLPRITEALEFICSHPPEFSTADWEHLESLLGRSIPDFIHAVNGMTFDGRGIQQAATVIGYLLQVPVLTTSNEDDDLV